MYYIKKDEEDFNAIFLIQEVIDSHKKLKQEKELELMGLYRSSERALATEDAFASEGLLDEILAKEEELRNIDIQISGIEYARDYVKLMLKLSKSNKF
jgi:hypothetical protein